MPVKVEVKGLREFRAALKKVDQGLGKELRQVHLRVGNFVAGRAIGAADPRVKGAIKGGGTQRAAKIVVGPGRGDALAVTLGQKRRSGWYARGRYRRSTGRQFRPWVGSSWDPGEGGGPYEIGPAIDASVDEVIEMYGDAIDDLARRAFPD